MHRRAGARLGGWFGLWLVLSAAAIAAVAEQPNIILFLADDIGYRDLGCYGSTRHRTPHIDALAAGGVRFTDFHSNSSVCSPTRAALLTGRYQQRAGIETVLAFDPAVGLSPAVPSFARYMANAGYATAAFGKWHLGMRPPFTPPAHGFQEFVGLHTGDGDHHSRIDRAGNTDWWKDDAPLEEEGYTADLITEHALDFIRRHRNAPFFLYVPQLLAHFPWQGPHDKADRVRGHDYEGLAKFGSREDKHAAYAEMIAALDDSVGRIIARLREYDLEKRTLFIFASDNGGYAIDNGGYVAVSDNSPLRGEKWDLYEGGHRVPAIVSWPGRIQPGVSEATVLTMDFLPTVLELLGRRPPAGGAALDGTSILPLLLKRQPLAARTVFWRLGDRRAVRRGNWKLVVPVRNGPPELYRLDRDVSETHDLAASETGVVRELLDAMAGWERDVDRK